MHGGFEVLKRLSRYSKLYVLASTSLFCQLVQLGTYRVGFFEALDPRLPESLTFLVRLLIRHILQSFFPGIADQCKDRNEDQFHEVSPHHLRSYLAGM